MTGPFQLHRNLFTTLADGWTAMVFKATAIVGAVPTAGLACSGLSRHGIAHPHWSTLSGSRGSNGSVKCCRHRHGSEVGVGKSRLLPGKPQGSDCEKQNYAQHGHKTGAALSGMESRLLRDTRLVEEIRLRFAGVTFDAKAPLPFTLPTWGGWEW